MDNPNVPPKGANVKPSPLSEMQKAFNDDLPEVEGQPEKAPAKSKKASPKTTTQEPAPGNPPGRGRPKTTDAAKAAAKKALAKKKAAAKKKAEANTGGGRGTKGPTLSKQWADLLLFDKTNPWFAEANHTSGSVAVHKWNGSYLQFVGFEEGSALVADWMDEAAPDKVSDANCNSAWAFSCKRLRTQRPIPVQDRKRNLIPCGDVYLEMTKDGITAIAPDPSLGMTYAVKLNAGTKVGERHTIKPLPTNSRFGQFLENALPDAAVRALVQEQCGLTLLPANFQIASWWVGAAGTGKSTLVELCKAMQRQVACISLDDLGTQFGLEGLVGASVVQVDEVEAEKWAEGKFKSLVSGNGVSINRKNEKALMDYSLRAKWLITSNAKPFVRDKSDGVWRRLCIVPFDVVIPEEERLPDFHDLLLEEEGAQILDWMLEGAQRLVNRGRFMPEHERPEAVRGVKEESRNDCDSVRAWVRTFDVCVGEEWQTKDKVYEEYEAWCLAAHQEPLVRRVFWKGLRGQVAGIINSNRRINKVQIYYCNLSWTIPEPQTTAPPSKPAIAAVKAAPAIEPTPAATEPKAPDLAARVRLANETTAEWDDAFNDLPYLEMFERPAMQGRA